MCWELRNFRVFLFFFTFLFSSVYCELLRAKPKTSLWSWPGWRCPFYRARCDDTNRRRVMSRPLVTPPRFPNWIGHPHRPGSSLAMVGDRRGCRIQLRETRLRMRSVSEIVRRSPDSERNSTEQHRPPSIRQSFSHGDVCFYQSSPLFRFCFSTISLLTLFIRILTVFTSKILKFPTLKWVNRYFRCLFLIFSTECSENCRLVFFKFYFSYNWILFLIVLALIVVTFFQTDRNSPRISIGSSVFATFPIETRRKVCNSRNPMFQYMVLKFS